MDDPADVAELMTVARAIEVINAAEVSPRRKMVALSEAPGHRLAEALTADRDYPPFDKSLMDGYAVRTADVAGAPVRLRVTQAISAGTVAAVALGPGEAMSIMTGAPVPRGADAVVAVEQTRSDAGAGFAPVGLEVTIGRSVAAGQNIARRGGDATAGRGLLERGALLGAAQLAVAATIGATRLSVFERPRVAVLGTGDELVRVDQTPGEGRIRDSNTTMLVSLLRRLGCDARDLGVAADDPRDIRAAIESGLSNDAGGEIGDGSGSDAVFVAGGMSMGEHDHVPRLLVEMGARLLVRKLKIRPGKPFVLAAMGNGKYVFGLPGNPVSAYVCTLRLASRLLTRMAGGVAKDGLWAAALGEGLAANGPREFYQPARVEAGRVWPLGWKGSADLFTLATADGLIVRPADDVARAAGENVWVLPLP